MKPLHPHLSIHAAALVCALTMLPVGAAHALSFAQAWQAAYQFDAQYQAASYELAAARQSIPIARAALLPQVALNVSSSEVVGTRDFPNSLNQQVRTRLDYSAPQSALTLRMPIFNREAQVRLMQVTAQTEVAESIYRLKGLDLVDRLVVAYIQVLLAGEGRQLALAQVQAQMVQLEQLQQRLLRGEGTKVDTTQSQAALDMARVRVTEASDQLELTRLQLRRITGVATPPLLQLPADYRPAPLLHESLTEWLTVAVRQNPSLQAREQALVAARMNVKRNFAAHFPRLDLVASVSRSQNESTSNLNQTTALRSLGMQLNVPLFSGGGIDASVKQAVAEQSRAEEEIRIEREGLEIEVQRYYQAVATGQGRMDATRNAVEAAEFTLQGTGRALQLGLATGNDVADTVSRLYAARRELAQSRFDYLLARARLMVQAGMPMTDVAAEIDRVLGAAPAATPPSNRP